MSMTREEKFAKEFIIKILSQSGYPTYARLLKDFDINLTANDQVVAYMEPGKGRIVINRGLDEDQVSVIIRHEILHHYLQHESRVLQKLAKEANLNYDDLTDIEISDLKKDLYKNQNFNIAADYEISNRAYTDKDKEIVRQINVYGRILSGLVTEDDHPDWVDLTVEEMFDKLKQQERKQPDPDELQYFGVLQDPTTFIDLNGRVYGI